MRSLPSAVKPGATCIVDVCGVYDQVAQVYADDTNTSGASGSVLDANYAPLASPIVFTPQFVAGSKGNWRGLITATQSAGLTIGANYWCRIIITFTTGVVGVFFIPLICEPRD